MQERLNSEPFGRMPFLLGVHAADALYDLSEAPRLDGPRGRWSESDYVAFFNWIGIEDDVLPAQVELSSMDEMETGLARLNGLVNQLRVALPYTEAERLWLYDSLDTDEQDRIEVIRSSESRIVSAGRRETVTGRELLRRWWSWRRETDEYAGHGSLALAKEALSQLVRTFAPEKASMSDQ